jgi:PAS domain-containing protein
VPGFFIPAEDLPVAAIPRLKRGARFADDALEAHCARAVMFKLSNPAEVLAVIVASQYLWIFLAHRRSKKREALFRIITENVADMIALVDTKGRRLYLQSFIRAGVGLLAARTGRDARV